MKKIAFITIIFSNLLYTQDYPKDFIYPLQIPISLSATYAELRKNHFHAGLDIRTQQKIGLKVVAPQDGYVSRINISAYGYGKAIYIDHPNGYTTVYGHLSTLAGNIEERARKEQYEKQAYSVDFYLKPGELPVKQGELVALSGNTGGSGGPHLHFEVRNTRTEEVLNPFLFGFDVPDNIKPQVNEVWIYPVRGTANGSIGKIAVAENGIYTATGEIGFGVRAYDKQNVSNSLNGIYFIKTYVNGELISTFKADKHAFDETRAINASVDYPEQLSKNRWIYRTYIVPGNTLQMYEQEVNKGIVRIEPEETYQVRIEVGDYAGNITSRSFTVKGAGEETDSGFKYDGKYNVEYNKSYTFSKEGISVKFEKGSFYESFNFSYEKSGSNQYRIHDSSVPVHKKYEITITPDWTYLDKGKAEKYVIIRQSNFGTFKKEYLDTTYKNGVYTASPKDFGVFSLVLDESLPTISCPTLAKTKKVNNRLNFTIKDTGSGINTYDVFIDGKWVLAEYEYKQNSLFIPDLKREGIEPGIHQVEVRVTDKVNNKQTYTNDFEKL
ncbi:MAG: M23 family metallopeptidase [Flavobacteriaceae bacterium]|jgi:hypothetical protein|nr:M23 family metallopeptidase [Flavobacteriaceae bacterium]